MTYAVVASSTGLLQGPMTSATVPVRAAAACAVGVPGWRRWLYTLRHGAMSYHARPIAAPKITPANEIVSPAWRGRFYVDLLGQHRIFNAAEYRFYRSNSGPPLESDTPFATDAALDHTPADTFADGTWYLSVSYFNGVIDSGFLPLGTHGETYLRIDVTAGTATAGPPLGPLNWRLATRANGVVRVVAVYLQDDSLRATEWAIGYTINGSTPPADSPDVTSTIPAHGMAVLEYDLPAANDGTTVKVRLQTRRLDDAVYVYSEASDVQSIVANTAPPSAPVGTVPWPGTLPEDV